MFQDPISKVWPDVWPDTRRKLDEEAKDALAAAEEARNAAKHELTSIQQLREQLTQTVEREAKRQKVDDVHISPIAPTPKTPGESLPTPKSPPASKSLPATKSPPPKTPPDAKGVLPKSPVVSKSPPKSPGLPDPKQVSPGAASPKTTAKAAASTEHPTPGEGISLGGEKAPPPKESGGAEMVQVAKAKVGKQTLPPPPPPPPKASS